MNKITGIPPLAYGVPIVEQSRGPTLQFQRLFNQAYQNSQKILTTANAAAVTAMWGSIGGTLSKQPDLQSALDGKQPLDGDLTAISALTGTNTIYYRSAVDTWSPVTVGTGLSFAGGTLAASAGAGTTTNPVTFSTTGGATPGTAFDGSAAVTVDYSTIGAQVAGSYLTANQTITLSGDATGSGATAITVALAASGVTAATYGDSTHVAQITVDAKGRITSASNVAISGGGSGGSWIPVVTGAEPPVLVSNGAGVLLLVAGP